MGVCLSRSPSTIRFRVILGLIAKNASGMVEGDCGIPELLGIVVKPLLPSDRTPEGVVKALSE